MAFDPILNDIKEITGKDYFKLRRFNFWKDYADFRGQSINPDWFKRDYYEIPMTDLDLDSGKQFTTFYTPKLSETIKRDIRSRFNSVLLKINKNIAGAGKNFNLLYYKHTIISQVQTIQDEVKNVEAEDLYRGTIISQVEKEFVKFKAELNSYEIKGGNNIPATPISTDDDSSSFYYKPYGREDGLGEDALEEFIMAFRSSNLIYNASPLSIKKFFIDKPPSRKIRWKKSGAEFKYFFLQLKERDFIKTSEIWKAAANHFELIKKGGAEASNEEMKGQAKLKNSKKRMRIDALIELLEIQE